MPRFKVNVTSRADEVTIREENGSTHFVGSAHPYIAEAGQSLEADARASEARTYKGPELTVLSEFIVSAADVDEAEAIGLDVFRAALLKAGAPADRPDWKIYVGAIPIDEATGYPVQPAASVIVVLGRDARITITWDDLQALQRRLEHNQETDRLREKLWQPLGDERLVMIGGFQAVALRRMLEDWSVDLNAGEAMPPELEHLRDGLVETLRDAPYSG